MRAISIALALFAVGWQSSTACRADILVAGFDADLVLRYDSSGGFVGTFAAGTMGDPMNGPTAMVYNSAGSLLVLNEFSHNVLEFNGTTGAFIGEFISPMGLGSVGVTDPNDMEIGPDGHLYISTHISTPTASVWKFNGTTGAFIGEFASVAATHHTHGLAFGPDGNLYQGDISTSSVVKFDGVAGGTPLGTFATAGGGPLWGDIVFGPAGHLFATLDGGGGALQFGPGGGMPLGSLPLPMFTSTWGLLVDSGILYVGGKSTGFVKRYDATTGAFIDDFITFAPGVFDMLILPTAVPEVGAAALLTLAATCAAAGVALKKWRTQVAK